jgi:hypothetical protein
VALTWLTVYWLRQSSRMQMPTLLLDLASALLCGLGLYWFIARSYGVA